MWRVSSYPQSTLSRPRCLARTDGISSSSPVDFSSQSEEPVAFGICNVTEQGSVARNENQGSVAGLSITWTSLNLVVFMPILGEFFSSFQHNFNLGTFCRCKVVDVSLNIDALKFNWVIDIVIYT
jgi:hypothetical protein